MNVPTENGKSIIALNKIFNTYDCYFINNKYGDGTHTPEFTLLFSIFKDDDVSTTALNWIKNCYDCFYKNEYIDNNIYLKGSAFEHLLNKLKENRNGTR